MRFFILIVALLTITDSRFANAQFGADTSADEMACGSALRECNSRINQGCFAQCTVWKTEDMARCKQGCQIQYGYSDNITKDCQDIVTSGSSIPSCRVPVVTRSTFDRPSPDPSARGDSVKPVSPTARTASRDPSSKSTTKQPGANNSQAVKPASSGCITALDQTGIACSKQGPALQANNSGGINGACTQANNSGVEAGRAWGQLGDQCLSKISTCHSACADTDQESACDDYESNAQYMYNQQDSAIAYAGQAGTGCQQQAGGAGSGNGNGSGTGTSNSQLSALGSSSNYAANNQDFCLNPQNYANPQCRQQVKDSSQGANFENSSSGSASANDFNVPSTPGANQADASLGLGQQTQKANSLHPNSLASGYGGSNGLNQAQQRNNQDSSSNSRAKGAGGPGHNTEVQAGERSGGGYQSNKNGRRVASVDSPGLAMFNSRNPNGKDYRGIDLKEYLPGGKYYQPTFSYGPGSRNPQLHGPHEFLFEIIHKKYMGICQEGRLIGCPAAGDHKRW